MHDKLLADTISNETNQSNIQDWWLFRKVGNAMPEDLDAYAETDTESSSYKDIQNHFYQEAQQSLESCLPVSVRLDRYAEAAWYGSVSALYDWAMLLAFGSEGAVNKCGIDADVQDVAMSASDQARAMYVLSFFL
jgi:hypothetical protein